MTDNLDKMSTEQLRSRLITMRDKISVLEWDEKHDQINPYKKVQLDNLRKEYREIEEKVNDMVMMH
jgi:hypothetical protein